MALFEISKLRERTIGNASDTSEDTFLTNLGTQADNQIVDQIYHAAARNRKVDSLPVFDIANATIDGTTAQQLQAIRDACTDRAAEAFWRQRGGEKKEASYKASADVAVKAFVDRLKKDAGGIYGKVCH